MACRNPYLLHVLIYSPKILCQEEYQVTHKKSMSNGKLFNVNFTPYDFHEPLIPYVTFCNVGLATYDVHEPLMFYVKLFPYYVHKPLTPYVKLCNVELTPSNH